MFSFFGRKAYGILAPRPGVEPAPSALEGEVMTTGQPGKSLCHLFKMQILKRGINNLELAKHK